MSSTNQPQTSPPKRLTFGAAPFTIRRGGDDDMYQPTTQGGYSLFEAISALQKEIRRGNEEQAMYWALEFIPYYERYVWERLIVIVNEDIGIANPSLLQIIPVQRDVYFEFRQKGKDGPTRLALANAVLLMCRSPKSRIADHFQCVVNQDRLHGKHLDVPDYALDKHTQRGRSLKRGTAHWLTEGCQLSPQSEVSDPYAQRAAEWWSSPKFVQTNYGGDKAQSHKSKGKYHREFEPPEENPQAELDFM